MSLALVQPLLKNVEEKQRHDIEKWVSTTARYLNEPGRITMKDLKSDLKRLNLVLPEERRVRAKPSDKGKKNKPEYVAAVVTARKRMKAFDSACEDNRRAEIGSAFVDWTGKRTEALDEHYTFEDTTARHKWSAVTYTNRGKMQVVRVDDSDEAPANEDISDGDDEADSRTRL